MMLAHEFVSPVAHNYIPATNETDERTLSKIAFGPRDSI